MTDDLIPIDESEWLGDYNMGAWFRVVDSRGGCRCCVAPPCNACTEPVTEEELNSVGYTYIRTQTERT